MNYISISCSYTPGYSVGATIKKTLPQETIRNLEEAVSNSRGLLNIETLMKGVRAATDSITVDVQEPDYDTIPLDADVNINISVPYFAATDDGQIEFDTGPGFMNCMYEMRADETKDDFIKLMDSMSLGFSEVCSSYGESTLGVTVQQGSEADMILSMRGCNLISVYGRKHPDELIALIPPSIMKLITRMKMPLPNSVMW